MEDRSLLGTELTQDPHPYLHQLRGADPVHWSETHRAWLLTRYDDVGAAFRDLRLSSARIGSLLPAGLSEGERDAFEPIFRYLANWMVFKDPPDHVRLRRLARAAFAVRTIESLRPMITAVVDDFVERLAAAGRADFVETVAAPLPAVVIATVLGVPPADQGQFRGWSDALAEIVMGTARPDRRQRGTEGLSKLEAYFRGLLRRVKEEGADSLLGDLARAEEKGEVLSEDEVVATCILLLFAGHETTTALLASMVFALSRFPEEKARLIEHPELVPAAVEEALRFEGPSKMMVRIATEDVELRGRRIRSGERVFVVQAAANRDPDRFPDPDRFDAGREDNEHHAFGYGIHHCLGAPLARLEAQIALSRLLSRVPELRVVDENPPWLPAMLSRRLERLEVEPR